MTGPFVRVGDAVRMQLRTFEVDLLRRLRDDLHTFLSSLPDDDPVTSRLFPTTVVGDDDADEELRRLVHEDLLEARLEGLEELLSLLERATTRRGHLVVDLTDEEPAVVLGVLNDLRLALGARVQVDRLDRERLEDLDEPTLHTLAVMDHLAGLQEELLAVLDPSSVQHYDEGHDLPD